MSFYEITNGQHFDAFLSVAGFDTRFIPAHYSYLQAPDLMWDHLTRGTPLPPIASAPATNAIQVANGVVDIPR